VNLSVRVSACVLVWVSVREYECVGECVNLSVGECVWVSVRESECVGE